MSSKREGEAREATEITKGEMLEEREITLMSVIGKVYKDHSGTRTRLDI